MRWCGVAGDWRLEPGYLCMYVLGPGARAYVVCSLTVALSLRQSPHINQQIALNELPADMCERASAIVLHPVEKAQKKKNPK